MPSAPNYFLDEIDLSLAKEHDCPGINSEDWFLAYVMGRFLVGTFSKQHYGWNFDCGWGASGVQFDAPGYNASSWARLWRISEIIEIEPVEEPEEESMCDECGFPRKAGNLVYRDDGKRPLCRSCNPDKYTWVCGPCGNRLSEWRLKPAECWYCLNDYDPGEIGDGVASGRLCGECGKEPKRGNKYINSDGRNKECTTCGCWHPKSNEFNL